MKEKHFVEGTTHITYLHKNDERRSKFHCKHLHIGKSCPFWGKCIGSSHCFYYDEDEQTLSYNKATNKSSSPTKIVHPFSGIKELNMKDILIDSKFLNSTPNPQKVQKLLDYYEEHKKLMVLS